MVVLRLGDLFELSTRKLRSQAENDLQVCRHPIIFNRIFSIDLSHHQSESHWTLSLVTLSVAAILSLAMTACTRPYYWWQKNLDYRNAQ